MLPSYVAILFLKNLLIVGGIMSGIAAVVGGFIFVINYAYKSKSMIKSVAIISVFIALLMSSIATAIMCTMPPAP